MKKNVENVYVVIPVFNRKDITLKCIEQLEGQENAQFQIVIVDDGSKDGTEESIKLRFPKVHIVKGDGSWWWTKSVNEGCKFALGNGASAIVLMNDDTKFSNNFFELLFQSAQNYPDSIIGAISVTEDKPYRIFFSGVKKRKKLTAKSIKYHSQFSAYNPNEVNGIHPTEVLPGRGIFIPSKVFREIGFFNQDKMPQYFADFDFTNRAKRNGYNVLINWDLVIYAMWKETGSGAIFVKQKFSTFIKAFFNKYSHRSISVIYYYFKEFIPWYVLPFTLLFHHIRVLYSFCIKKF